LNPGFFIGVLGPEFWPSQSHRDRRRFTGDEK
jgi:hypothetical protein